MLLKDQILADMKTAMREKNSQKLEVIRMLRAAVQREEVDSRKELDDKGTLAIVIKLIKQSQDSIEQFLKGDRQDLADKETIYITHLSHYLPEQLSADALSELIDNAIKTTEAQSMRDMGKVMALLKPEIQGKADMSLVSQAIKSKLV